MAEDSDTSHRIKELEDQLSKLRQEYSDQGKTLTRAAELGKKLLDENGAMEGRMVEQGEGHRKELEVLEQQKYSLQRSVEQKTSMEVHYLEEIEGLKHTLQSQKQLLTMKTEAEYQQQLTQLKKQVSQQQNELDRYNLSDKQLRERNQELEKQVDDTREQLQQKVNLLNETCSEEMAQLHVDISNLQGEKLALLRELGDNKDQVQQLLLAVNSAKEQLAFKDNEIEERACQATSYYNALEKSREENQELKVELDLLRLDSQDQKTKGNSLFSEVEDRRVVAEKQLVSLKVEYESLRKQYEASRQNHCRLRMQLAGLLMSSGGRADAEHMASLQQQLSQKKDEVQQLMDKLHRYEKEEKCNVEAISDIQDVLGGDNKNYVDYLQALQRQNQRKLGKVQDELRTKSLQLLAESDKLMQCESKLYSTEKQLESTRGLYMKQQVELDEIRLKYEPDKLKTSKKIRKTVKEQIPLSSADLLKTQATTKPLVETGGSPKQKTTELGDGDSNVFTHENQQKCSVKVTVNKPTSVTIDRPASVNTETLNIKDVNTSILKTTVNKNIPRVTGSTGLLKPDEDMTDKHFSKSMKKRKVTISDENEIVEPESPKYNEDNDKEEVVMETEGRLRGRVKHRKNVSVPVSAAKLGQDANDCKTQ